MQRPATESEYGASLPVVACAAPVLVIEFGASAPAVTCAAPALQNERMASSPAVTCAAPAPVLEYVASAPAFTNTAPAQVNEPVAPAAPAPAVTCEIPAPATECEAASPGGACSAHTPVREYVAPTPVVFLGIISSSDQGCGVRVCRYQHSTREYTRGPVTCRLLYGTISAIESVTSSPASAHAAPAPLSVYVASPPAVTSAVPAPVIESSVAGALAPAEARHTANTRAHVVAKRRLFKMAARGLSLGDPGPGLLVCVPAACLNAGTTVVCRRENSLGGASLGSHRFVYPGEDHGLEC